MFPFLYDNLYINVKLPKGTVVFREGDMCEHVAFIVSGVIRVAKIGENGKEVNLYRVCRGESCVLTISSVLSHSPFPATAIVEEDAEAIIVPKDTFATMMATNTQLQTFVYDMMMNRFMAMMQMIEHIVFEKMDKRLIEFLLDRCKKNKTNMIEMTHEHIAIELGTAREVVSRILKQLEREGYVQLARGKVKIVDKERLCDKFATM
ncbi:Crp/Fnr family transcriptional regulator [Anoxybacillus eryuanensis]|uniref:cAMP-binding domain of CRP or a regulatory subunit of cAMP-dependent protein kinases n=1 Tax=Anoxybacillus suryakundensis TaxID=1325335 RepID=A0A0K6GQM8_9BACL|nr:cAMP-binding domain of CRP or a regulatory subunit of cAMP-dependent protein kinases [Anoxybacillus suryakundensis]